MCTDEEKIFFFIIDQKTARHSVQLGECLSNPLPFYANLIIAPFLNSWIPTANHDKE